MRPRKYLVPKQLQMDNRSPMMYKDLARRALMHEEQAYFQLRLFLYVPLRHVHVTISWLLVWERVII